MDDRPSLREQVFRPRTFVSVLATIAVVYLVFGQGFDFEWSTLLGYVRNADPIPLAGAFVVFYGLIPVRTLRWRTLLENVGQPDTELESLPPFADLARIVFLAWFANSVTIARLGDAYRAYLLRDSADVSFTVTLGTILAERVLDLTVMVVLLIGVVLVGFHRTLPATVSQLLEIGLATSVLGIGCVVVMRRFRGVVERILPARLHSYYANLEHGTIDSFDRVGLLVGYSVVCWVIEGVAMYLVTTAVGAPVSLVSAFVVALVAALISTIPITVGGLGVAEASIILVLQWTGLDAGRAGAIALVSRCITYWSLVFLGGVLFVITRKVPWVFHRSTRND